MAISHILRKDSEGYDIASFIPGTYSRVCFSINPRVLHQPYLFIESISVTNDTRLQFESL
jgi:hypothetical protein